MIPAPNIDQDEARLLQGLQEQLERGGMVVACDRPFEVGDIVELAGIPFGVTEEVTVAEWEAANPGVNRAEILLPSQRYFYRVSTD